MSKENFEINQANFVVSSRDNELFTISLETSLDEKFAISVHSIFRQRVVYHKLKNKEGKYWYELDMNYAPSGVYLVRVGNEKYGKVKQIVVK